MSKIIKKAFGDNSHYKLFRYPYDDTQIHEEDTINNEKIVIRWIGNDQEELYFYNNCLTKVKEIEPKLCVYQIDKNKDLVIGWKRKDEATPRVELTTNTVRERVLTTSNQEVTSSTILHIGDKIHFVPTASSNIQRYDTEAHDPDSITWSKAKTITDYGEIQLNYQKVELTSIDQDPKTPFTIVNNSKANIVITNPYDNNKVVHTGDAVFYKHNFFHATMNENYAFDPDGSHFIELVDKSANLYRITDNNPYFNIKYAGKVKIVIQDPSNYNVEYRVADGGLISNNDMLPVGSIIKIRLARDNVDLKDMPEHTTLVSQTFWNTDDDPYDLRKDYNVKINEEEDLTTITLKPPQPQPSTVFKTNANKYNDKVTVESHINHVTADPLPSDPTWFSQFEVVKISFKGNYGETGYKIDSVQNAIHCGEDYYQANGAECIINISEVSDYKLRILKSAPGATAEECGVYDMEVQNKKYPDGAILSLDKIIRLIPQENFIIDQDRLVDLELVDSNISSYKVTGLNPTVATKVAPFVTVTNENPDKIVIRTTKYPQITLSTYPDNTHVRLDNQITMDIDSPNRRSFKIIYTGLEYLNFSDYYKVIGMNVNAKFAPKKPPLQIKLSGPNIENAVYNDSISRGVENNDPVYEGERIWFKYPNGFTTLTEVVGLDVLSEAPGYRNTYTVKEDATEVKLTWTESPKAHLNNTTPQIIVVSTVETEDPEAITDFPENVLHIGEQFKVAYFYSVEHPENYEIKATNAKFLEVDADDGARIYKITGANPTVKAIHKPKNVTVYIPKPDDTKYTVLQENDAPITDGAILKSGQSFKIKMINKNYEYTSDSIIDCTLSSTSHYGDNIPIYTFTIKEDIVADSITIPPPIGGANIVLNILPNENSDKLTVTAIDDSNRLITTYPDNSLHLGERFKVEVKPEFSEWWRVKDVYNGSKVSDGIWKVAGDPCNIIVHKLFNLTVYTAGGNDPNEVTFYKTNEGLDENIINDISLIKFSKHDRIHFRLCKWVEVDNDNSNLITHVNEENGVLTYFVDGEGCILRTKLKNNAYMISVNNAADGVGHVYRENGTTLIDNHYYVEKDEIIVAKVEDPKIVPDATQLELVSHENNTYKFKVLSGTEHPSISLNDHTPVLIDSNHPDWITVRKDDSTGPVLTLPDNTTFRKYMNVQLSIELKDEFDPRCYEIAATGVIEYGPGQYREKESPIEEDVHITVTLTKGVLHILKSSPSSTEEEFDLVDPDNALHIYAAEDAYPIGTKMKFVPKDPKYKVDLGRCKDVSYDSGVFTITGPSPTVATKENKSKVTVNATCGIDDEILLFKSKSSGEQPIDIKTENEFDIGTKLYLKLHKYVKIDTDQSSGIELVGEEDGFIVYKLTEAEAKFTTDLKDDVFEIMITISESGSAEVFRENETDKLESGDYIAKDEKVVLKVTDAKYVPIINELDELSHIDNTYKYNVTGNGNPSILVENHTPIVIDSNYPEALKVMDEFGAIELTLPNSTKYNFSSLSKAIRVRLKDGFDPSIYSFTVDGATATGLDNIYQFNNPLPTKVMINVSSTKIKLKIIRDDANQVRVFNESRLVEYNDGDEVTLESKLYIQLHSGYSLDMTKSKDIEAVDASTYLYKVSGNFPTIAVKEELAVFKIPDEDHVRVRRYDNNVQINNGDTLRIGTAFTVTFPNKYKLKGGKIKGAKKEYSLENVYYAMEHEVEVIIEERPFATINVTSSLPYTLKALIPSVKPITSLPNSDTLRVDDKFSIEFNNEDDRTSNKFVVTGAIPSITKINGESIKCFLVTETTVNVEAKPKVVTFTNHNEDVYKVTKFPEGDLIPTGYTGLKIGQKIKIELLDDGYQLNILGLERLDSEYPNDLIYKITGEQVDIFGIPFPFVTVNNANPDIIAISKKNDISKAITTYPNTDTIRRGSSFYIFFKPPYSESTHTLKVEGANLDNNRYVAYDDIYVSATTIPSKLKLEGEFAGLKVTAESDGRELHDGDTSIHKGDLIKLTFQPNYMLDGAVTGAELTDATNNIYKITEELVTIKVKCKVKLKIVTHQTPPEVTVMDPTHMTTYHNDDEIEVGSKIAILPKPGFAVDSDKIVDIELVDTDQSIYKITGLHPTVECKQVNTIIHIPDEAHVDVFTVPGNEQIHDNDVTQQLNNQLKVIPKYPYKLKNNAIIGMEVVDADNGIYKITEYAVTIELEELEFASIDALPADIFKVKTVRTPIQEITTFPNNNTLRITDKFTLEFKNSDDGIKYDVGVTGATLVSGNTYQVESNIVSITAEDKQVTVHIHNSTHVTVTKHPSSTPVVDGDTTVKILDILKIIPEEGYKVSTTTGLEADPLNENCYKVKETNVVIDVETYPFITINNQNTDVLAVCTTNNISTAISTFPNSDTIRKTTSFYILYKGSNNASTHSIVVTGATLVSGNKYIADEDTVEVKAVPKFTPSKINISGETTGVTVKAVDDGRELHDGDTSVKVDDKITVVLKPTYKFEVPMTGVEATGNSNEYKITDTEVTIKVKQIQFVTIDNESPTIITVKTIDPEEEITTFPCTDKLQEGQLFSVTFKNSADAVQYTLSVIGANHTTGDQYIPTANSVTIKAVRKVVIHIPDETHVQVTKVPENTQIHNNDNTLAINDQIKIVAISKWEYKLKPVVGATVVDVDNGIYKITAVDVTIEVESVPFITINNDNQDIVAVYTKPGNGGRITTFPRSDKVHQNQDIYVKYVNEATQKPVYDISVVGATANTEEYSYKAGVVDITVSASRKVLSATIHINHAEHVTVKAVDDGRELHDGDTSVSTTQFITIVPKAYWHMKSTLLRGLETTSEENKFMVIDREVFIDVEEDQVVTINNLKKALLKVEVGAITLNTFPDSTHLHMDEEFIISFFNASLDPKYDLNVTGAAFISTAGNNHKYKATSSNIVINAEPKPVPATIHITGDANIDVTTVPGGVAIHDGDTSQFVGNKLKIVPKHGYKLKLPLSGIDVEDVSNNIYKITDENVTIEAVLIPFVTINNESTDLLKVIPTYTPSEELTVFPCSDKVHEDENFIISFKLASNAAKYDVVVTGATRVAGNIYKATTANITVKAEAKFPPATIHIIDGDHVDVADATSGRVILDNDTLMFVGDTITVVPKSGYRLKQKVGLELLSKPSKLYKIANASVTIEVEEIPTPPAPPPSSLTHNTILWYLKSLFYGGV